MLVLLFLNGCDKGLEPNKIPPPPPYGFKGVVYFQNWPPSDSVKELRVVAFQNYPPGNIATEYIARRLRFSDDLKTLYGNNSIPYIVILNPMNVDSIPYVAIGQRFGDNLLQDWKLVGVYFSPDDSTRKGTVKALQDSIVRGINIFVDFHNLPPQP